MNAPIDRCFSLDDQPTENRGALFGPAKDRHSLRLGKHRVVVQFDPPHGREAFTDHVRVRRRSEMRAQRHRGRASPGGFSVYERRRDADGPYYVRLVRHTFRGSK